MSTRSEIQWENHSIYEGKKYIEKARIYKHSDGYPEGNIADIKEFAKWDRGFTDVEYSAANFIYWEKREMAKHYEKERMAEEKEGKFNIYSEQEKIGYGVETPQEDWSKPEHGDIEYTYLIKTGDGIDPKNPHVEIAHIEGFDEKTKSKVIFKGTLNDAYKRFVEKEKPVLKPIEDVKADYEKERKRMRS